jgi:GT2 family glycosyltransferase
LTEKTNKNALILIPTMGSPDLIVRCVRRIMLANAGWNIHLFVVANPKEDERELCDFSRADIEEIVFGTQMFASARGTNEIASLNWLQMGAPAGWVGAVNEGLKKAIDVMEELPEYVVVMNDDALVSAEWLDRMSAGFEAQQVFMCGEPDFANKGVLSNPRALAEHDRIGMIGCGTNNAASMQMITAPKITLANGSGFTADREELLDQFANKVAEENTGSLLACNFLSGFLIMYKRECLLELIEEGEGNLLDPCYGIGGHDDNDIAARGEMLGWRQAIVLDVYVHHLGHQTLDKYYPEAKKGTANIDDYYKKWNSWTQRDQTMAGLYRVRLFTMNDLFMFRDSIKRACSLLDGFAVLMTDNPAKITQGYDYQEGAIQGVDLALIEQCTSSESADEIKAAVDTWLKATIESTTDRKIKHCVDVWQGEWNERDERNASFALAESLDTDWLISIDHDEIIEDRITRQYIEHLMKHPDPLVQVYDIGWLNHWDTPRLIRVDVPWCAPNYQSSMRGFRIWRHNRKSPRRIVAGNAIGLHCGNSPDYGIAAKRVCGLRMRHFGYLRPVDRQRKYKMYTSIDPSPDTNLTGGSYDHLVAEENMRLTPYVQRNGISYSMLVYKDDQAFGVAQLLSHLYALCDFVTLVWTGPEGSEPSPKLKAVGDAYGAEWIHTPFTGDLSECRNSALDLIRANHIDSGVSWFLTMDDDEAFDNPFDAAVAIRRMAEVSDGWGWMFRFRNFRSNGEWQFSETQRMFRVEKSGQLYYSGRVHETVEKANREMVAKGISPQVRFAPFTVNHYGLMGDAETMQKKLSQYTGLLLEELKLRPNEPAPWVSLGLQYGNDGLDQQMIQCLEKSCSVAGNAYLPYKELGTVYIRLGRRMFEESVSKLSQSHPYYKTASQILSWLTKFFPEQPKSGHANPDQTAVPVDFDLDHFLKSVEAVGETSDSI